MVVPAAGECVVVVVESGKKQTNVMKSAVHKSYSKRPIALYLKIILYIRGHTE